jgi:hypothetical protein
MDLCGDITKIFIMKIVESAMKSRDSLAITSQGQRETRSFRKTCQLHQASMAGARSKKSGARRKLFSGTGLFTEWNEVKKDGTEI